MRRSLRWVAVLGAVGVPAIAAACWPGWGWQSQSPMYVSAPTYSRPAPPMYVYPPPVYQPAPGYMLAPPRIDITPQMATPFPAPPSGMGSAEPTTPRPPASPPRPPTVDTIRSTGGNDASPSPMAPSTPVTPSPMPSKKADQPAASGDQSPLKYPTVEIPKGLEPLPKLEVPKEPDFRPIQTPKADSSRDTRPPTRPERPAGGFDSKLPPLPEAPKLPSLEMPKDPAPKLPPLPSSKPGPMNPTTGGNAVPSPAPAMPEPLILPSTLPPLPDPKKPEALPSLTLPPDSLVIPSKPDSTSRYSPLTSGKREPSVNVFPASGAGNTVGGYRTVGFYNHTDRDLSLTIEGRAVKLPAKTYLHAKLGPTFTWSQGDQAVVRETVPEGSSGVDVVFRD